MASIASYRDLEVWKMSMDLASGVYALTRQLPKHEEYRLSAQLIRAAASVPANISEGFMRGTRKDYAHFVSIARGSLAETETFLLLIQRVGLVADAPIKRALQQAELVGRMLTRLRQRLSQPKDSNARTPKPITHSPTTKHP